MPYINQKQRKVFNPIIDILFSHIDNKGEVNYCITRLVHLWVLELIKKSRKCYDILSKGHNVLQDATAEYYRVVIAPYEDIKKKENGFVSELDSKGDKLQNDYEDYSYYVGTEITCGRTPLKYSSWLDSFRKE